MTLNMGTDQKYFTMLDTRKLPRRSISLIGPYKIKYIYFLFQLRIIFCLFIKYLESITNYDLFNLNYVYLRIYYYTYVN